MSFEKINKIDKPLEKLEREDRITNISNERDDTTTDSKNVQRKVSKNIETNFNSNKFNNLAEIGNFQQRYKLY